MRVISICLTDIPKDAIKEAKNGKKYVSITVANRLGGADQYGNDQTCYITQSKEERANKDQKKYVGNGKTYTFDSRNELPKEGGTGDLPF